MSQKHTKIIEQVQVYIFTGSLINMNSVNNKNIELIFIFLSIINAYHNIPSLSYIIKSYALKIMNISMLTLRNKMTSKAPNEEYMEVPLYV
jgi:hypothetical protein